MPDSVGPQDDVESTGAADPVPAEHLWKWLTAKHPPFSPDEYRPSFLLFALRLWPSWALSAASKTLSERVGGEEGSSGDD
jgi:hypothetical protein